MNDQHRGPATGGASEQRATLVQRLKATLQTVIARALQLRLVRAYLLYAEHRGPALADSVTYRTLFSVFAGVLLGFSAAALWLGGNPDAMQALVDALDSVVPGVTDAVDVQTIEVPASFTVVGAASLVGLIGAAMSAVASLRTAFRTLADRWHDDEHFVRVLVRNLLVMLSFGALVAVAAALSVATSIGLQTLSGWFRLQPRSEAFDVLASVLGAVLVFAIDVIAVALVIRLLSGVAAPASALWQGAMLGGFGLLVLQQLSGLFVRGATSNPLLASFAALIALLIWLNLSAQVILLSGSYVIVATAEAHDRVRQRFGASTLAQLRRRRAEDVLRAATRDLRAAQRAEQAERDGLAGPDRVGPDLAENT